MINQVKFGKRLEKIIHYYGFSASSFAEKIGVQRSSISHILSNRNKPSLEFILKVLSSFPEVDLYWLLNGKGSFPKQEEKLITLEDNFDLKETNPKEIISNREIRRIVIFYSDGSFEDFEK